MNILGHSKARRIARFLPQYRRFTSYIMITFIVIIVNKAVQVEISEFIPLFVIESHSSELGFVVQVKSEVTIET